MYIVYDYTSIYIKKLIKMSIYSNSAKKVILVGLSCPCEENMEKWLPLQSAINSRGWEVDLYAIKEGARGFCFRSLLCCLQNLGFNILAKITLKTVSKLSIWPETM